MKKGLVLGLFMWTICMGQTAKYDFLDQIGLIKSILPNADRIGVMLGPTDYDTLISSMGAAQSQFGITIIPIKLNNVKNKAPQYVKMAAMGVAKKHGIKALIFVHVSDEITKSQVGIKFTASALRKQGIAVFSSIEKSLKLGCLGRFVLQNDSWIMRVNSATAGKLGIVLPSDDPQFIIE